MAIEHVSNLTEQIATSFLVNPSSEQPASSELKDECQSHLFRDSSRNRHPCSHGNGTIQFFSGAWILLLL